jgi:hypothetical protein
VQAIVEPENVGQGAVVAVEPLDVVHQAHRRPRADERGEMGCRFAGVALVLGHLGCVDADEPDLGLLLTPGPADP